MGAWAVFCACVCVSVCVLPGCGETSAGRPAEVVWAEAGAGAGSGKASQGVGDRSVIDVVATVGMVADLVRNVGGDRVRVTQLMGPGVDPHLYRVTRDDVRKVFAADVIFASGLKLEGNLSEALRKMSRRKPVEAIGETLWARRMGSRPGGSETGGGEINAGVGGDHEGDGEGGEFDPHLWMDVALWAGGCERIAELLAGVAGGYREEFMANAVRHRDELLALHRWGVGVIGSVPPEKRLLVTSHEAFGHFATAYGIEAIGVQGLATDAEAGLARINRIVDRIVEGGVGAVFVESSVPTKTMDAVIEGAAARGHRVVIGGVLFSDACGPVGRYEGTYMGMMDHNFTKIARGLGGAVSPRGFRGLLATDGVDGSAEVSP